MSALEIHLSSHRPAPLPHGGKSSNRSAGVDQNHFEREEPSCGDTMLETPPFAAAAGGRRTWPPCPDECRPGSDGVFRLPLHRGTDPGVLPKIQKEFAEYGYGLYAAQEKASINLFMGFIGFHWARLDAGFAPCVEIGWRLDHPPSGEGLTPQRGQSLFGLRLPELAPPKVCSYTTHRNLRSQRV